MRPPAPRVVLVGMSNVDHIWQVERFPPLASRTPAATYRRQGGGPAATAGVAVARLGGRAELWSLHGDDDGGRGARAELEGYGVDCSRIRTIDGATTPVSAVLVAPGGERAIFPHRDPKLFEVDGDVDDAALDGVACVMTDNRYAALTASALRHARRRGIPTVGDWSDPLHWELTRHVDHLIVSEECATALLGPIDLPGGGTATEAAGRLRSFPGQVVGVTVGERGFVYDDGSGGRHLPAHRIEAVDTTGAGDVFHGAYAYGVAHGWDVARCAGFASVAAGLSCRAPGRGAVPTRGAVDRALSDGSHAAPRDER